MGWITKIMQVRSEEYQWGLGESGLEQNCDARGLFGILELNEQFCFELMNDQSCCGAAGGEERHARRAGRWQGQPEGPC